MAENTEKNEQHEVELIDPDLNQVTPGEENEDDEDMENEDEESDEENEDDEDMENED